MTTPWERANYVSTMVAAALEPGGPLARELSDVVSKAAGVAMAAAGVPDTDDRGAEWPMDHNAVIDAVVDAVREVSFRATLEYVGSLDKPQLSVVS